MDDPAWGRTSLLARIVNWFRVGYPAGMPPHGYAPIAALLDRRLTDQECHEAARRLRHAPSALSDTEIRLEITTFTQELPLEADVQRVREIVERQSAEQLQRRTSHSRKPRV